MGLPSMDYIEGPFLCSFAVVDCPAKVLAETSSTFRVSILLFLEQRKWSNIRLQSEKKSDMFILCVYWVIRLAIDLHLMWCCFYTNETSRNTAVFWEIDVLSIQIVPCNKNVSVKCQLYMMFLCVYRAWVTVRFICHVWSQSRHRRLLNVTDDHVKLCNATWFFSEERITVK